MQFTQNKSLGMVGNRFGEWTRCHSYPRTLQLHFQAWWQANWGPRRCIRMSTQIAGSGVHWQMWLDTKTATEYATPWIRCKCQLARQRGVGTRCRVFSGIALLKTKANQANLVAIRKTHCKREYITTDFTQTFDHSRQLPNKVNSTCCLIRQTDISEDFENKFWNRNNKWFGNENMQVKTICFSWIYMKKNTK